MSIGSDMFRPDSGRVLCRLCLGSDGELLDIFGAPSAGADPLPVRITDMLQLEIVQSDNLPKWICKRCVDKIDDFSSFRERCKENELKLRRGVDVVKGNNLPEEGVVSEHEDDDAPTDDEETELIVIDPTQDYESSNQSLPIEADHEGENGTAEASEPEPEDEDINGSLAEEGEEDDEDEDDTKCDTFPKDASNGMLAHGGSTNASPQKTMVFTCKYCDVAFAASSECQLHELQDHDLLAPYACMYCGYKTAIRLSLISHLREMHLISRPYICVQCNKGFPRRSDLKKHTFVHTGMRPYACDQCGKSFSRNTNLTKHMRIHSGFKPHACAACPRSFANRADLVRHQKIHSGQGSQFSCGRCGNTYARKDKLYSHERVCCSKQPGMSDSGATPRVGPSFGVACNLLQPHDSASEVPMATEPAVGLLPDPMGTDLASVPRLAVPPAIPPSPPSSKIYSCTECPKRFLSKVSLHVHKMTHTSEDRRFYECPHCQKRIVGRREFERHLIVHTSVKPFGCRSCGRKFTRKDRLHRHERNHQLSVLSFSCPNCSGKFDRRDMLATHLKLYCRPAVMGNFFREQSTTSSTDASAVAPGFGALGQQLTAVAAPSEHSMAGDDAMDSGRM